MIIYLKITWHLVYKTLEMPSFMTERYTNKQKFITYNKKLFINNHFNQIIASLIKYYKVNTDINGYTNILTIIPKKVKVSIESKKSILVWVCIGFMNNPVRLKLEDNFLYTNFSYETTTYN